MGIGAGERGDRGGEIGGGEIVKRVKAVEGGFAGGDKVGVLPPGDVLDDLVEGRSRNATAAGRPAELLRRRHCIDGDQEI